MLFLPEKQTNKGGQGGLAERPSALPETTGHENTIGGVQLGMAKLEPGLRLYASCKSSRLFSSWPNKFRSTTTYNIMCRHIRKKTMAAHFSKFFIFGLEVVILPLQRLTLKSREVN